jgi:hypothetical protein
MPVNLAIRSGLILFLALLMAGCSTVESRIRDNPQVFESLSPSDQALVRRGQIRVGLPKSAVLLALGKPDHMRNGVRMGRSFEAWIYTTTQTEFVPGYYPGLYQFGYYRYHRYFPYHRFGGFYGDFYGPFLDDTISYEVPLRTVFFENGVCTGWDNNYS